MVNTAMILAAGFGTRMGDLTKNNPKPLLPISDKTLLEISIQKLINNHIKKIIINTHYLSENIQEFLNVNKNFGIEIILCHETEILGTGGGIANAEKHFKNEAIVVLNSDVLCSLGLGKFIRYCEDQSVAAAMAVLPSQEKKLYSLVRYNNQQDILGFLQKGRQPARNENHSIFTGIQYLTAESRKNLRVAFSSIITDTYLWGIQNELKIKAYPISEQWIDFGTETQYLAYIKKFKSGELKIANFMH